MDDVNEVVKETVKYEEKKGRYIKSCKGRKRRTEERNNERKR